MKPNIPNDTVILTLTDHTGTITLLFKEENIDGPGESCAIVSVLLAQCGNTVAKLTRVVENEMPEKCFSNKPHRNPHSPSDN